MIVRGCASAVTTTTARLSHRWHGTGSEDGSINKPLATSTSYTATVAQAHGRCAVVAVVGVGRTSYPMSPVTQTVQHVLMDPNGIASELYSGRMRAKGCVCCACGSGDVRAAGTGCGLIVACDSMSGRRSLERSIALPYRICGR